MGSTPSEDPPIVDSTAALASLYQAPLAEFITRRSALVSQLKRSGHREVAARIAAASKPSRAAYLVNQVYWRARPVYDAVLDSGTAARAAQQARLLGDMATDLDETLRQQDAAVRAAVEQAIGVATAEGQPVSESVASLVRASFVALAAHGLEARLTHGHLTEGVALPGLAAFAGLVLPPAASQDPVRRFEVVARRRDAEATPESTVPPPDPRIAEAEAQVAYLRGREMAVTQRLDELKRGLLAADEVAVAAERAAAEAAQKAVEAREAVRRAEATRNAVEQELARVHADVTAAETQLRDLQSPLEPPPPVMPTRRSRR